MRTLASLLLASGAITCSMSEVHATHWKRSPIRFPEVLFLANSAEPLQDKSYYYRHDVKINTMREVIAYMARTMKENPGLVLEVKGYTDPTENGDAALALERAQHVACMLSSEHRMHPGRLVTATADEGDHRQSLAEIERMPSAEERSNALQLGRYVAFKVLSIDWTPPISADPVAAIRSMGDLPEAVPAINPFCNAEAADLVVESHVILTPALQLEAEEVASTMVPEDDAPIIAGNPIQNNEVLVHWKSDATSAVLAEVMGLDGRILSRQRLGLVDRGGQVRIPLPFSLTAGTYNLHLVAGGRQWTLRFVK